MYYNKTTHLLQVCRKFDTDPNYTKITKFRKVCYPMENFNEFYHNENTTETQKGKESFTQSSTVILSPTEKEIPPIPPKNNRPPLRARVIVVLCIVCSLLGGLVSTGSYALYQHYKSSDKDLETTPINPSVNNPETLNTSTSSKNNSSGDVTINVENVTSPATAVAKKVSPSIVGIRVTTVTNYGPYGDYESSGEGSGIVYTSDGYIITNYHVVKNMLTSSGEKNPNSTLTVYLNQDTSKEYTGTVIGYDQSADLAVIKINATALTPIEIGDSDSINVGDIAIAIGNPGGLDYMGSTSQGIISGLNRMIQTEGSYENLKLIQTDAAINPGNSGGALCDVNGKLIGVNSVKLVQTGYEGMGFAIPVNDAVKICDDIIQNGSSSGVYLGLEFNENFTAAVLQKQGYPVGIVVSDVASNSPAEAAGFETDDILTSFNGSEITSTADLINAKKSCKSGDTVYAKVYRLSLERNGFIQKWVGNYVDLTITFE